MTAPSLTQKTMTSSTPAALRAAWCSKYPGICTEDQAGGTRRQAHQDQGFALGVLQYINFEGGKPRSISTDGTVSPTLMVFLPKGPRPPSRPVLMRRGSAACALLLTVPAAGSAERRLRCFRAAQTRHARDAATVSARSEQFS